MDSYLIFVIAAAVFAVLAFYFASWFDEWLEDLQVRREMRDYLHRMQKQFDEEV